MSSKVVLKLLATILVIAGCVYMTIDHLLHPLILGVIAVVSLPLVRGLYVDMVRVQYDNVRKFKKHLPKIGFIVEVIKPQKDSDTIRFVGTYRDETMVVETGHDTAYVTLIDPAWLRIATSDPNIPKFMEAINITNGQCVPTIVCSSPDADGNRFAHTICSTIVLNVYISDFLNSTLIQIVNKKAALNDNFKDYH